LVQDAQIKKIVRKTKLKSYRVLSFLLVAAFWLCALFYQGCDNKVMDDESKIRTLKNDYLESGNCVSCHTKEHNEWTGSHHDWAMKLPDPSTVLGDFNNAKYEADGVRYFFKRSGENYIISSQENGQDPIEYRISYTFGVTPLQQYLVEFPGGKYQVPRVSWDTEKKTWFHQYAGTTINPNDWLHWTNGGQRWNTMCAECHSTNLQKNYDRDNDIFNTTFSEINVGCESCHGMGKNHVQWAESTSQEGHSQIDSIGDDQNSQLNTCGACHSRRVKLTAVMDPQIPFAEQFMLQNINEEFYFPDGQIDEEDYVLGSFVQSKMYKNGVICSDCHDPHSLKLKFIGNALCLQCHEPSYDLKTHHFHEENTAQSECVNCHMPGKNFMGNDFRRDHSFRVPRPDQSIKYGTPNTCTGCHSNKSDEWASENIIKWYGPERKENYSDHLLLASKSELTIEEKSKILDFIGNIRESPISRSTVLEYIQLEGSEAEIKTLLNALKDSSALVRYNALRKLGSLPPAERTAIALEYISDQSRLVRIGAAQLVIDQATEDLPPELRDLLYRSNLELEEMLNANSDFPLGRLQYGDYYMQKGKIENAIEEYEMANKMDPLLTPVYSNLATAYNLLGKDSLALESLNRLILLEPEYARAYYLRGLLNYELGNTDAAIQDLKISTQKDPGHFRAFYNLANLYLKKGDYSRARKTIFTGLKLEPSSEDGKQLLNIIQARVEN
jgi:tetratricopeptide (TPR) repeat protein/Zn ribbon nucleic-acid-binding protein